MRSAPSAASPPRPAVWRRAADLRLPPAAPAGPLAAPSARWAAATRQGRGSSSAPSLNTSSMLPFLTEHLSAGERSSRLRRGMLGHLALP